MGISSRKADTQGIVCDSLVIDASASQLRIYYY